MTQRMLDADFFFVDARKIRGRQIDLARRHFQGLAGVPLVAYRKFDGLSATGSVHDHLACSQRCRQRDADYRNPLRIVLKYQCAMPVRVDVGQGRAGGIQLQDLDPARHGILIGQDQPQGRRGDRGGERYA